jgi:hypothetical protein
VRTGSSRRLRLAALLAGAAVLTPAAGAPAGVQVTSGFKPRPLFATPGLAAYCYVDGATQADARPRLFCWTPDDGYGIHLVHRGGRPYASYSGGRGRLTMRCISRRTGLTCRNTLGHGFWLGRFRGVRRF